MSFLLTLHLVSCSISSAQRTTFPRSAASSIRQIISPAAELSSFALWTGGRVVSGGEHDVRERRYPAPYLAFSRSGVPAATISPFCITITESESNLVNIILEGGRVICFLHRM